MSETPKFFTEEKQEWSALSAYIGKKKFNGTKQPNKMFKVTCEKNAKETLNIEYL